MTDKLFDDFFKKKLEDHDSGAPMHVWEKVRRELHEDDDDKGIIWWRNPLWLIALFLFIGGGTAIGIAGSKNNWFGKPTVAATSVDNESSDKTKNANAANELIPSTETIKENKTTTGNDNASINTNNIISSNDNKSLNTITSGNNDGTFTATTIDAHQLPAGTRAAIRKAKHNKQNLLQQSSDNADPIAAVTFKNIDDNYKTGNSNNDISLLLAQGVSKTSMKSLLESQKLKAAIPFNPQAFTGCPTIGPPQRNDLYIEVYGSPDNASRNISGTSFTPANYIDKRKDAEKSQVGFSAGIRIAKNLGERLLVKTGINYSQINETLKYLNEKDVRIITVITTRTVTSGGQTITISDTTSVTQVGTSYNTFYNRYRTLDIPLIFSYELGNSRNFSVGINAGAIINIKSWYSGHIIDTNLQPVKINTVNTLGVNAWRKNIGLGLYASLSIYKRINDKMQLFFEPYTRINLNPVTVSQTVVKQKYTTSGLQIGLRYNLFHNKQRYVE